MWWKTLIKITTLDKRFIADRIDKHLRRKQQSHYTRCLSFPFSLSRVSRRIYLYKHVTTHNLSLVINCAKNNSFSIVAQKKITLSFTFKIFPAADALEFSHFIAGGKNRILQIISWHEHSESASSGRQFHSSIDFSYMWKHWVSSKQFYFLPTCTDVTWGLVWKDPDARKIEVGAVWRQTI